MGTESWSGVPEYASPMCKPGVLAFPNASFVIFFTDRGFGVNKRPNY
jgi:hypothetical protein